MHHPNIVPLLGASIELGKILLIMKHIAGSNLDKLLFRSDELVRFIFSYTDLH